MKIILSIILSICIQHTYAQKKFDNHLTNYYNFTIDTISPNKIINPKNLHILDTRTINEFNTSKIPGAQFCNYNSPKLETLNWNKNDTVIVYCTIGYRSEKVGESLKKLGYKKVFNLYGGIINWANKNHQVVTPRGLKTNLIHTYDKSWSKWLTNKHYVAIY